MCVCAHLSTCTNQCIHTVCVYVHTWVQRETSMLHEPEVDDRTGSCHTYTTRQKQGHHPPQARRLCNILVACRTHYHPPRKCQPRGHRSKQSQSAANLWLAHKAGRRRSVIDSVAHVAETLWESVGHRFTLSCWSVFSCCLSSGAVMFCSTSSQVMASMILLSKLMLWAFG